MATKKVKKKTTTTVLPVVRKETWKFERGFGWLRRKRKKERKKKRREQDVGEVRTIKHRHKKGSSRVSSGDTRGKREEKEGTGTVLE